MSLHALIRSPASYVGRTRCRVNLSPSASGLTVLHGRKPKEQVSNARHERVYSLNIASAARRFSTPPTHTTRAHANKCMIPLVSSPWNRRRLASSWSRRHPPQTPARQRLAHLHVLRRKNKRHTNTHAYNAANGRASTMVRAES